MGARYEFVDEWFVPAPVEDVYDIVGDQLAYPSWWGDVFLEIRGDDEPPHPGRRASVVARGFLPYRLRFDAVVTAAERPRSIEMTLSGDFGGGGSWTFTAQGGGTRAVLDWRPEVEKPIVRYLTPLLRPLFRANHTWTMRRGQDAIVRLLEQRSASGDRP
jgi:uncharacterized protein YndB with AHSA1/START domain